MEGYVAAKLFIEGLRRAGRAPSRDALIDGAGVGAEPRPRRLRGRLSARKSHVASRFVDLSMLTDDGRVRV